MYTCLLKGIFNIFTNSQPKPPDVCCIGRTQLKARSRVPPQWSFLNTNHPPAPTTAVPTAATVSPTARPVVLDWSPVSTLAPPIGRKGNDTYSMHSIILMSQITSLHTPSRFTVLCISLRPPFTPVMFHGLPWRLTV